MKDAFTNEQQKAFRSNENVVNQLLNKVRKVEPLKAIKKRAIDNKNPLMHCSKNQTSRVTKSENENIINWLIERR